ncbi:MAG: hypothetical protein AAB348_03920 [Patescibacteria group bacterium]
MFFKKFIIIVALFSAVAVAAVLYLKFKPPGKSIVGDAKPQYSQAELDLQQKSKEFVGEIKEIAATDKDLDGILDVDEVKYKTSPTSSDTDMDGLMDKYEIEIFKTNPIKADTDGDGFKDGYEVRRGFNPSGPGKLK